MNKPIIEPIRVFCAADRGFLLPLAAMVKSVLLNLRQGQSLILYVIDSGLRLDDRQRLLRSWESAALEEVVWVEPSAAEFRGLPLWGQMKLDTYHRLMIAKWADDSIEKVIWLDADLIVIRDLTELWELDLNSHVLLASQDLNVPWVSSRYGVGPFKELGIDPMARHFNAGAMLISLAQWRENNIESKAMAYLRRYHKRVFFFDQEALNAVLVGQWGALDPRWNQISSVAGKSFFTPEHLDETIYRQVIDDPWVVRYAGALKPWLCFNRRSLEGLFFKYLDQTEWRGSRTPKTLTNFARGLYEEKFRDHLYPLECWAMFLRRWWGNLVNSEFNENQQA